MQKITLPNWEETPPYKPISVDMDKVWPEVNKRLSHMPDYFRIWLLTEAPTILKVNYLLQWEIPYDFEHKNQDLEDLTDWVGAYVYAGVHNEAVGDPLPPKQAKQAADAIAKMFEPIFKAMTPDRKDVWQVIEFLGAIDEANHAVCHPDEGNWLQAMIYLFTFHSGGITPWGIPKC